MTSTLARATANGSSFVQICNAPAPSVDWSRFDWWNRFDDELRRHLRLDLLGAERLRELLRRTLEEEEESDTPSDERIKNLEALAASFEIKLSRVEQKLREREGSRGKRGS